MRNLFPLLLLVAVGCDESISGPVDPCPAGTPLSDVDLPCDCQGAVVEALTCGDLVCDAAGLAMGDTGGCSSSSYSSSR